jgi:hypothetical protein
MATVLTPIEAASKENRDVEMLVSISVVSALPETLVRQGGGLFVSKLASNRLQRHQIIFSDPEVRHRLSG